MPIEHDIVERIRAEFVPVDANRAIALLSEFRWGGRVRRCVVVASRGSFESLEQWIRHASIDARDVIVAGEYEGGFDGRRVRDLRVSFVIDSPEKMWIGELACMMHARGYALSSVEARPARVGPFQYEVDRHEGVAKFTGPMGPLDVEKRDRRWTLGGDFNAQRWEHLTRPYEDEQAFRDAVSGFLLVCHRDRTDIVR